MEGVFNQPWAEEHGLQLIEGLHKLRLQPRRRWALGNLSLSNLLAAFHLPYSMQTLFNSLIKGGKDRTNLELFVNIVLPKLAQWPLGCCKGVQSAFLWCRSTGSFVLLPGELLPGILPENAAELLPENSVFRRERSVSVFGRHKDPSFWGGSLLGRLCFDR